MHIVTTTNRTPLLSDDARVRGSGSLVLPPRQPRRSSTRARTRVARDQPCGGCERDDGAGAPRTDHRGCPGRSDVSMSEPGPDAAGGGALTVVVGGGAGRSRMPSRARARLAAALAGCESMTIR